MSDALKPQLHGRDHREGGRDPIPTSPWGYYKGVSRDIHYNSTGSYTMDADWQAGSAFHTDVFDFNTGTGKISITEAGVYWVQPNLNPRIRPAISSGFEFSARIYDNTNSVLIDCWSQNSNGLYTESGLGFWNGIWRGYAGPAGGASDEVMDLNSGEPLPGAILQLDTEDFSGQPYPYYFTWTLWVHINGGTAVAYTDTNAPTVRAGLTMYRMAGPIR